MILSRGPFAEISFHYPGIVTDNVGATMQDDLAGFHDICIIGDFQSLPDILLNQQNRSTALANLANYLKNIGYHQRCQAHGRFIQQQ